MFLYANVAIYVGQKSARCALVETWHAYGCTSEVELESEHEITLSCEVFCEALQSQHLIFMALPKPSCAAIGKMGNILLFLLMKKHS